MGIGNHNHCRNPDNEPDGAWCYTMNPSVRWQFCDVPSCVSLQQLIDQPTNQPTSLSPTNLPTNQVYSCAINQTLHYILVFIDSNSCIILQIAHWHSNVQSYQPTYQETHWCKYQTDLNWLACQRLIAEQLLITNLAFVRAESNTEPNDAGTYCQAYCHSNC